MDVVVEGAGPASIVMVHGWPDTHRLWDRQVAALKDRYRCVRFTLPGFEPGADGRAHPFEESLEAMRGAVEQACPGERVTLLLHDWGCLLGYQFAMRHPALVARVIGVDIGDAGSRAHRAELGARGLCMVLAYQLWLAFAWKIGGAVGDAMARWMAGVLRAPAERRTVSAGMGYHYAMRWLGAAGGFRGLRVFRPEVPMLYIYGERKPLQFHSRAWTEAVAARAGNRVVALPGGHWIMVERPEAFNTAVLAWLGEHGGAPAARG